MKRIGVVLLNLGGPNNRESVQPFLYNLFMDDDIFKVPVRGAARRALMKFVTTRRAKSVAEKYSEINACPNGCLGPKSCSNRLAKVVSDCCSSTNPITEWQRRALEKKLNAQAGDTSFKVVTAMRYWNPTTDEAMDELQKEEVEEVVLLPLYPQFSYTTTASSFKEWERKAEERDGQIKWKTHHIPSYHLSSKYLQAINQKIEECLALFPTGERNRVHFLFSAHGTPVSFQKEGDPYSSQIKETIEAVMQLRSYDRPYWLSYQSRVGPVEWLKPNTEDFIKILRGYGIKNLLVIPIAFVSDHIETSFEIGVEFKEIADEIGIDNFHHTSGLNDDPLFIECLADLVRNTITTKAEEQGKVERTI